MLILPPTSLYIHMPWCIKKCPYCDFNSHEASTKNIPEDLYIDTLLKDLQKDVSIYGSRSLHSIFIGGGTPSLFSGKSYTRLLDGVRDLTPFTPDIEITLEANPHSSEHDQFRAYLEAGVNRVSIGVQSFHDETLKIIGRVHSSKNADHAIASAKEAGFKKINLDLMYASPMQTTSMALDDLHQAIDSQVTHISWYQFTLEPNTYFHKYPPQLPSEETIDSIESQGLDLLIQAGFKRYEISAFQQLENYSQHNLNYWRFGDYYGIGAGAHGKLTIPEKNLIARTQKYRMPKSYLEATEYVSETKYLTENDRIFEFMLNALRLEEKIYLSTFESRTGLDKNIIINSIEKGVNSGWLQLEDSWFAVTTLGRRFTNNVQALFL